LPAADKNGQGHSEQYSDKSIPDDALSAFELFFSVTIINMSHE
jgi:hypothetical protein